jgi:hypothetical protein
MIKVFTAQHHAEAHWIRGLLQAEGIPAEIRGEHLFGATGAASGIIPGMLPTVWILDDSQFYRAKTIVTRFLRGTGTVIPGPVWTCPGCGEKLEPQFSDCWKCGTPRPEE